MLTGDDYKAYLQSAKWVRKRQLALERFQHRCGVCYSDGKLAVHHRTYERSGDEPVEDLIPLCEDCHEAFHGKSSEEYDAGWGEGYCAGLAQVDEWLKQVRDAVADLYRKKRPPS